jgi:hypothetical protein
VYGKVVDEWKVGDTPVRAFAPRTKLAPLESTILAVSNNDLFVLDPRVHGNKIVGDQYKHYFIKPKLSAVASTNASYVMAASEKGDVRLFKSVGANANVQLPSSGEPITAVDVSGDDRWILATCRSYLLLIDTLIKEGNWKGSSGFERIFSKDSKSQPRRLQLL